MPPRKRREPPPTAEPVAGADAPEPEANQEHAPSELPPVPTAPPVAEQQQEHAPTETVTTHEAHQHGDGAERRKWVESQQTIIAKSMTADRHGPSATLFRDRKFKQMGIAFDRKPVPPDGDPAGPRKYTDMLHAEGYQWRGKEKVWTKQLDADSPAAGQEQAEKFFEQLMDQYRADHGLGNGHAVA